MLNPIPAISGLVDQAARVGAAGPTSALSGSTAPRGSDFAAVLADISADAVSALKASEAAALSGLQGQASVQEVVQAVMAAEETLQTALAIRDKAITAYQEVSRMVI